MFSTTLSIYLVFLFFITITEAGKHVDKIIIHVPYKILKHHHTHTKYKILTIQHKPKKENTIIFYKTPVTQHPDAKFLLDMDMKDSELKGFVSPYKMSEALLGSDTKEHLDFKVQDVSGKKPIELQAHGNKIFHDKLTSSSSVISHLQEELTPMASQNQGMSIHQHNHIPQFSFKPFIIPTPFHEASITPTPFHEVSIPRFPSITQASHDIFNPTMLPHKLAFKPPSKLLDSIPHTSSYIYNTIIPPRAPKKLSYEVKERSQEKHLPQPTFARNSKVPISKLKNFKHNFFDTNFEPDYEHVGYLIIDGNQKEIVEKDALHSWG